MVRGSPSKEQSWHWFFFSRWFLLRALGAGDWKLMGAVGSISRLEVVSLCSGRQHFCVRELWAIVQVYRVGRVMETLRNMWTLVKGFFSRLG